MNKTPEFKVGDKVISRIGIATIEDISISNYTDAFIYKVANGTSVSFEIADKLVKYAD
jgi:hypothetical protein